MVDGVDLAVGRGAGVQTGVLAHGKGMDLELRGVEEEGGLAVLDAVDLALVAGAHVEAAGLVARERPDVGRLRVLEDAGGGGEAHAPLGVDGEAVGLPVQEVARPLERPELRLGRAQDGGHGQAGQGQEPGDLVAHRTSQSDQGQDQDGGGCLSARRSGSAPSSRRRRNRW